MVLGMNLNTIVKTERTKIVRIICFIFIISVITVMAWTSDDAYHGYSMARNLVEGNGFSPTSGIRVNVSTCPLMTLLVAFMYVVCRNMYVAGMVMNFICSFSAIWILLFKFCKNCKSCIMVTLLICSSRAFISYTTSGLENALLFLLGILYTECFLNKKLYSRIDLFKIALLEGLIAFTRMDAALIFAFSSTIAYLFMREDTYIDREGKKVYNWIDLLKSIPIAILGLSPFIIWEVFSLLYYGFFFPNTMLAKLNTGYPESAYLIRGIWYYISSIAFDIVIVIVPVIFVIWSFGNVIKRKKIDNNLWIASGILLYMIYVCYIGGDFMMGRHFTVIFFIALICLLKREKAKKHILDYINMIVIGALIVINLGVCPLMDSIVHAISPYNYTNERLVYYENTGLPIVLKDYIEDGDVKVIEACQHKGIQWYYGHNEWYEYRLYDPLLSRLPAVESDNWMVGHMERDIPAGYQETLDTGINCIEDESLYVYYEKLRYILSGSLWDKERIREIISFNIGEYDYLLEDYIERNF